MIVVNGVPKSGTTLLASYLCVAGMELEPGGLRSRYPGDPLTVIDGPPWGAVRTHAEIMSDVRADRVIGAHVRAGVDLSPHVVAFIYRHPRNVLVSWARWAEVGMDWTDRAEPHHRGVQHRMSYDAMRMTVSRVRSYHKWLEAAHAVVRFEDLVAGDQATLHHISRRLGVPAVPIERVLGDAAPWVTKAYQGTWSGRASDWREYWNESLNNNWQAAKGPEAEAAYGYEVQW